MHPDNAYLHQGMMDFNGARHGIVDDGIYEFPFNGAGRVKVHVKTTDAGVRSLRTEVFFPGGEESRRCARKLGIVLAFRRRQHMSALYNKKAQAFLRGVPHCTIPVRLSFHPERTIVTRSERMKSKNYALRKRVAGARSNISRSGR